MIQNFQGQGVMVEANVVCVLCGLDTESVAHLLCHCDVAFNFWDKIMQREHVSWCMSGSFAELVREWDAFRVTTDREL